MNEFSRFLLIGGINTAVCYVIYLLLLQVTDHNIAYTFDYLFGIVFTYFLQLKFVFKEKGSLKKFLAFPSVYIVQYLVGLIVLNVAVNQFKVKEEYALFFAIIVSIPLTYVMSRTILKRPVD